MLREIFKIWILLILISLGLFYATRDAWGADEPIIATEVQGRHDSIVTGTAGDEALNLYTRRSPRGSTTIGTAGDRVILINRLPSRSRVKTHVSVDDNLFTEEDIGNPLEERRDE